VRLLLFRRRRLGGCCLAEQRYWRGRIARLGEARHTVLLLVSCLDAKSSGCETHHSRERTVEHHLVLVALPLYMVQLVLMLGRVQQ